jgi:hypothetical protein
MKKPVIRVAAALAIAAAAVLAFAADASPARAAGAPFCLENYSRTGPGKVCRYYTYAQCVAASSGVGGSCSANPWYVYPAEPAPRRPRARHHRHG